MSSKKKSRRKVVVCRACGRPVLLRKDGTYPKHYERPRTRLCIISECRA